MTERADLWMEGDDRPMVVICQGPPACDLTGNAATDAMEAGCVWCRREVYHPVTGWEVVAGPGTA